MGKPKYEDPRNIDPRVGRHFDGTQVHETVAYENASANGLTVSSSLSAMVLSLPMHTEMNADILNFIVTQLKSI